MEKKVKVTKVIRWKILNAAFWTEIVLSYLLPFRVVDNFQYQAGFPVPFISLYNTKIGVSPLTSMHLNPLALFFNGVIIYFILSFAVKGCHILKKKYRSQTQSGLTR